MSIACMRRKSYASEAAARSIVYRIRAQGSGERVEPYHCGLCSKWHLRKSK